MKILALQGGARRKGCTATVLSWVERELTAMGHVVESITLQDKNIKGCLACNKCKDERDGVGCIQKDDAIGILEKIVESDGVIFSSPLYFWGLAGPLKCLIDRSYSLYVDFHTPNHFSLVDGQRQALLMTGGGPYEKNAEYVFNAFDRLQYPHKSVKAGELYIGGCKIPESLTSEIEQQAVEFARRIAS